jgi:hypothetical protein
MINTDSIFFGNQGLTKTSANHIKDLASHKLENAIAAIDKMSFIDEEIALIGNAERHIAQKGWDGTILNGLDCVLDYISRVKSLQAWLGEALKAKNELERKLSHITFDDFLTFKGYTLNKPCVPLELTKTEWLETLNVKERNRFLHLETLCAVYGKCIHPNGAFDVARKRLQKIVNQPTLIEGQGMNTIFHYYKPSVTVGTIEEKYFEIQAKHREYQAEFNALQHKFELVRDAQLHEDMTHYDELLNEYQSQRDKYLSEYIQYKKELQKKVADLKVIIPHDLESIYNEINSLGK